MKRIVCWIRRRHEWGRWNRGILIRWRFCDYCGKRQIIGIDRT